MSERYRALVATEEDGRSRADFGELGDDDLPDGDVTVRVRYSSLNYKDGLAVTGRGKIVRSFPMVLGIDLAGEVERSDSPDWHPGDQVVVTGWGLSETHPGGFTQRQRLRSEWLVALPDTMSAEQAMVVGTAGLTSMLCVMALEDGGVTPERGPVVVSGAAGGVGSVACALLAALGYEVTAATGRPAAHDFLSGLGVTGFVDRAELAQAGGPPLGKATWAGAVDTVGSTTLATILSRAAARATVAACGLAGGPDLPTTVLPFILRNVRLQGVDSVNCPADVRREAWRRLAGVLTGERLAAVGRTEPLSAVPELAEQILAGRILGRVAIDVDR
ncbi:MAG: MDR family oxidoreductase [Acidimicrobiales bacterium]